jgi:hypothetical protein
MIAKSTKVLVAALTFAANASARPTSGGWQAGGESYMQEHHDPTNTNGN